MKNLSFENKKIEFDVKSIPWNINFDYKSLRVFNDKLFAPSIGGLSFLELLVGEDSIDELVHRVDEEIELSSFEVDEMGPYAYFKHSNRILLKENPRRISTRIRMAGVPILIKDTFYGVYSGRGRLVDHKGNIINPKLGSLDDFSLRKYKDNLVVFDKRGGFSIIDPIKEKMNKSSFDSRIMLSSAGCFENLIFALAEDEKTVYFFDENMKSSTNLPGSIIPNTLRYLNGKFYGISNINRSNVIAQKFVGRFDGLAYPKSFNIYGDGFVAVTQNSKEELNLEFITLNENNS